MIFERKKGAPLPFFYMSFILMGFPWEGACGNEIVSREEQSPEREGFWSSSKEIDPFLSKEKESTNSVSPTSGKSRSPSPRKPFLSQRLFRGASIGRPLDRENTRRALRFADEETFFSLSLSSRGGFPSQGATSLEVAGSGTASSSLLEIESSRLPASEDSLDPPTTIFDLPAEIFSEIFSYLAFSDLKEFRQTCRAGNNLVPVARKKNRTLEIKLEKFNFEQLNKITGSPLTKSFHASVNCVKVHVPKKGAPFSYAWLAHLPTVTSLNVSKNQLKDLYLQEIGTRTSLRSLNLSKNKGLTYQGFSHLKELINLTSLNISGCPGIGENLSFLNPLEKLLHLDVSWNKVVLEEELINSLKGKKLEFLNLSGTSLRASEDSDPIILEEGPKNPLKLKEKFPGLRIKFLRSTFH